MGMEAGGFALVVAGALCTGGVAVLGWLAVGARALAVAGGLGVAEALCVGGVAVVLVTGKGAGDLALAGALAGGLGVAEALSKGGVAAGLAVVGPLTNGVVGGLAVCLDGCTAGGFPLTCGAGLATRMTAGAASAEAFLNVGGVAAGLAGLGTPMEVLTSGDLRDVAGISGCFPVKRVRFGGGSGVSAGRRNDWSRGCGVQTAPPAFKIGSTAGALPQGVQ